MSVQDSVLDIDDIKIVLSHLPHGVYGHVVCLTHRVLILTWPLELGGEFVLRLAVTQSELSFKNP